MTNLEEEREAVVRAKVAIGGGRFVISAGRAGSSQESSGTAPGRFREPSALESAWEGSAFKFSLAAGLVSKYRMKTALLALALHAGARRARRQASTRPLFSS